MTLCRSKGEPGGVKTSRRTASMKSLVLDPLLALFPGVRSTTWSCRPLQGTGPFVFVPEGSPFDRRYRE
jgi:hypothetical protein